jgi:CDGSH-type Zn-finger protein
MEEVEFTPYRDGPILARGPVKLTDNDGRPIETHRRTVAICRCGQSDIRPFCDGTHKRIGFSAPGRDGRDVAGCAHAIPSEE